jgi:DnaJ-class molecular chaperone
MAKEKDAYQILGVSKSATQEEIKNAYRNLAKKHHPDLNPGNEESEAKFKSISAAYEHIGTAEERAKYDRGETEQAAYGAHGAGAQSYYDTQQAGGARYASGFAGMGMEDDFFENLFRSANRSGQGRTRPTDFPGEDQLYQMEVEFREAARGAEREISIPGGKKMQVKIPAGIESGAKLRFRGQGLPGVGKGPAGDLFIEIHVRPQAGFKRAGKDIETELPISFIEALIGAEVPVPTLDGNVMLKIPAGVNNGSRLRIRGKGIASAKDPGDQIVELKIVMPKKVDPALANAVREWGGKFSYDPRSSL